VVVAEIIVTDVPAATISEVEYICEVASEAAVNGEFNSEVTNCDTGLVVVKVSESVDMDNLVLEADVNGKCSIHTHIYVLYSENSIVSCLISTY